MKIMGIAVQLLHAEMIAHGLRDRLCFKWSTRYRGPLLICAFQNSAFKRSGNAICIADLVDCRPAVLADSKMAPQMLHFPGHTLILANVRRVNAFPVQGSATLFGFDLTDDIALAAGIVMPPAAE